MNSRLAAQDARLKIPLSSVLGIHQPKSDQRPLVTVLATKLSTVKINIPDSVATVDDISETVGGLPVKIERYHTPRCSVSSPTFFW